jgi:MFS family permease
VRLPRWSVAPYDVTGIQRKNFAYVQIDGIAIGLSSAAGPFLPVFLTRLGASNVQVGLLTAMPGITGLILAVFIGGFLQRRRNIVPWFSASRLAVVSAYAATGLAGFIVPKDYLVVTVLAIWALATIPQTSLSVCFSVVMNAVAGPTHRYDLMSRRWSVLGLTSAIAVAVAGDLLERIGFPLNYQMLFLGLSIGGLLSYYFSSHIELPDRDLPAAKVGRSIKQRGQDFSQLILKEKAFLVFSTKRFIYQTGILLATPLFPLYYVRVVKADDAWIGLISMAQTFVLLIGYYLWPRQSRKRGSRFVLICVTLGLSFYPALTAATQKVEIITLLAGLAGIFQAGIDLVFFDELMKTVPEDYSATFVSLAQGLNYAAAIFSPLAGTWLATHTSLGWALLASSIVRLVGFLLFTFWEPHPAAIAIIEAVAQQEEIAYGQETST